MTEQVLAERFAPLEFSGRFAGAKDAQILFLKRIDDAGDQRISGPTTVSPIAFFLANSIRRGVSVASIGTFTASSAVPALPGATKMFLVFFD